MLSALVVNMPNLDVDTKLTRPSIFSFREGSSKFFALYGSAGLSPVSALLKDILDWNMTVKDLLGGGGEVILEERGVINKALEELRAREK